MGDKRLIPIAVAFVISGLLALWGRERSDHDILWYVFKPLTTILLFLVVGAVDTRLRQVVMVGLVFSLIGDVGLLLPKEWQVIGLAGFLVAHVCYIVAFVPLAVPSWRLVGAALVGAAISAWLVKASWADAASIKPIFPYFVAIYALALTTMVVSAVATIGGTLVLAVLAAIGACCFYVGDATIALTLKNPDRIAHAWWLTSGVYWVGQFFIAWAARVGTR